MPPDNWPALTNMGGAEPSLFCWAPALAQPPCDDPLGNCDPDEPEEPPCDDIIGNCEEPPTPPDCFIC